MLFRSTGNEKLVKLNAAYARYKAAVDAAAGLKAAPVSYTHLDVYKRQSVFARSWRRSRTRRPSAWPRLRPVSYTHLTSVTEPASSDDAFVAIDAQTREGVKEA